jgi:glycosyltransferase involved in cell wall biosynthesis
MSLYIDLTEFLRCPLRTGIQRVVGEMCRHLPSDSATPIRLKSGQYVALSHEVLSVIGDYFTQSESKSDHLKRLATPARGTIVTLVDDDSVLVPEVFFQRDRIAFYRTMSLRDFERHRFLVYDLLPLTHPEYFVRDMPIGDVYGYFRTIRRASNSGFISEYTRETYYQRLIRTYDRGGVVLHLGADALGPRPDRKLLKQPLVFSVIGTIEPRKNHELILDAFEPLLREVEGLSLLFIGRMGWVSPEFSQRVQKATANERSGFRFVSTATDRFIRQCVEESRATIYISAVEGYGLPPVESLWVGTPVIGSSRIPSLEGLGSAGIHIVDPPSVINLRQAILAFLDDGYAERKKGEARSLTLPTWRSFTDELLQWCAPKAKSFRAPQ